MAGHKGQATPNDLPDLLEVFYSAYEGRATLDEIITTTTGGQEFLTQMYERAIKSEPAAQQPKLFVVRDDNGKVVSSALYYIVDGILWPWRQRWPEIQEGMNKEKLEPLFDRADALHSESVKGPHLFVGLIATHKGHQKRGHATALLKMGNDLADEMDYQCYVVASTDAKHIYESLGYVVLRQSAKDNQTTLIRTKKSERE